MSRYLLFQRHTGEPRQDGVPLWSELGSVEAGSAEGAVRVWMDKNKSEIGGTFLAIPERSSKPIRASIKTERRVRLGVDDQGKPA